MGWGKALHGGAFLRRVREPKTANFPNLLRTEMRAKPARLGVFGRWGFAVPRTGCVETAPFFNGSAGESKLAGGIMLEDGSDPLVRQWVTYLNEEERRELAKQFQTWADALSVSCGAAPIVLVVSEQPRARPRCGPSYN